MSETMRRQTLNARVRTHLGGTGTPHVIHRTFPEYLAADIAIASSDYFDELAADVVRFSGDPLTLLEGRSGAVPLIGSPILEQLEIPGARSRRGLREGLALFRFDGTAMVAYCRWERGQYPQYCISVLGRDLDRAQQMLDRFSAFAEGRRAITSTLFGRVAQVHSTPACAHTWARARNRVCSRTPSRNIRLRTSPFR
jgi:hypothetical protein